MTEVLVPFAAKTDIGLHRSGNEDSFVVVDLTSGEIADGSGASPLRSSDKGLLFAVSDGMGGAAAGEVASEMSVNTIRETLLEWPDNLEMTDRLRIAIETANARIWAHARANPAVFGMGATMTAVLLHERYAYVGQVGDSRAYLLRSHRIQQLTRDQSLAQLLVDSGAILPEQVNAVPQNVIMQALGTQPGLRVVLTGIALRTNDCLLLCSDGLSNKMTAEEMLQIVDDTEELNDLEETAMRLIDLANDRGGEDNITVILARFEGESSAGSKSGPLADSVDVLSEDYLPDDEEDQADSE